MQWFSQDPWRQLVSGEVHVLSDLMQPPAITFPGAFNPLHDGHRQMAEYAAQTLGNSVCFELSIKNVDKPPLAYDEVARRIAQFSTQQVVLTAAATFAEKARLFPNTTFLVGVDTLLRIGDERYYDDSRDMLRQAIQTIAARRCRFLVFGREIDGEFHTLENLTLPTELGALCQPVAEQEFRLDVSSTNLRDAR